MALSKTSRYESLKALGGLDQLPPEVVRMARSMEKPKPKGHAYNLGPTKEKIPFDRKPFETKLDIPSAKVHRTSTRQGASAEKR